MKKKKLIARIEALQRYEACGIAAWRAADHGSLLNRQEVLDAITADPQTIEQRVAALERAAKRRTP